nr:alpha/beta fold hydrolase [Arthrobacter roseus]
MLLHGFASSSKLNWVDSGWVGALTAAGRCVITVDLPGHGESPAPAATADYAPSAILERLQQLLQSAGITAMYSADRASGVDIIGYSLGSRLAWELGAARPDLVNRMVLGGPGSGDPLSVFDLPAARAWLDNETPIGDPLTAELLRMAQLVPSNNVDALMLLIGEIKRQPFVPAKSIPTMPLLLVAGDRDDLATTMPELAKLSGTAETLWLPARTHANAVSSRAFKKAAVEFLAG